MLKLVIFHIIDDLRHQVQFVLVGRKVFPRQDVAKDPKLFGDVEIVQVAGYFFPVGLGCAVVFKPGEVVKPFFQHEVSVIKIGVPERRFLEMIPDHPERGVVQDAELALFDGFQQKQPTAFFVVFKLPKGQEVFQVFQEIGEIFSKPDVVIGRIQAEGLPNLFFFPGFGGRALDFLDDQVGQAGLGFVDVEVGRAQVFFEPIVFCFGKLLEGLKELGLTHSLGKALWDAIFHNFKVSFWKSEADSRLIKKKKRSKSFRAMVTLSHNNVYTRRSGKKKD